MSELTEEEVNKFIELIYYSLSEEEVIKYFDSNGDLVDLYQEELFDLCREILQGISEEQVVDDSLLIA